MAEVPAVMRPLAASLVLLSGDVFAFDVIEHQFRVRTDGFPVLACERSKPQERCKSLSGYEQSCR